MNKNLINYSKFVLSCGILAGICFYTHINKDFNNLENELEEMVSSSIKLNKDSVENISKHLDYKSISKIDYNNQNP